MPIRVVFQNINNFGVNRFFDQSRKRKSGIGGNSLQVAAEHRLNVICNVVTAANPDLFSVVEVNTGLNGIAEGNLTNDTSSVDLLDSLNAALPAGTARNYKLVPPLVTGAGGRAEGIAVFYDMATLQFLGPWVWPGGQGPSGNAAAMAGAGGVIGGYPAPWTDAAVPPANNCLPHRPIPNMLPGVLIPAG